VNINKQRIAEFGVAAFGQPLFIPHSGAGSGN
jgi:hypothetical protein